MCTESWLPEAGGYRLYFNRDERRTRAPAIPPAHRERDGTSYLAPQDGDFGGTWIGVNEHAVTAAILNRYEDTPVDATTGRVSRGLLLASLLSARSVAGLIETLAALQLSDYLPFTIVAAQPGDTLYLADWTGSRLDQSSTSVPGMGRTSSGRDQREAERIRGGVWHELRASAPISPDLLERFHRGHQPVRGPFSVCMHREEAETQSLTMVHVSSRFAAMSYVAGPPCEGNAPVTISLPLVGHVT